METSTRDLALKYWEAMETNDFAAVGPLLSDDFVLDWPMSNERIVGRENLAAMNTAYPAEGLWTFRVESVVADDASAVTDVVIMNVGVEQRCITFFTYAEGLICKIVEYYPDPTEPETDRKQWTEPLVKG